MSYYMESMNFRACEAGGTHYFTALHVERAENQNFHCSFNTPLAWR